LQNCGKRNPKQVGDLDVGNPLEIRPNGDHSPNESAEDKENVEAGEIIVAKAKLEGCEGKIKKKVENKWKCDYKRYFFRPSHQKNFSEGNGDENVKHRPYRPK